MRRLFFLLSLLAGISLAGYSQTENASNGLDTIIKIEGKIMPVEVVKVTSTYIRFNVPDNEELFTLPRKEIHKVIYKNGRIEEYNPLAIRMIDEDAWQAVWVTEDPKDVESLYKLEEIEADSPASSRSPKAAKQSAMIRIQKKAAAMNGMVVLLTKTLATGGYGEFPGYHIEGVVYGTEPPEDEGENKEIL